MTSAYRSVIKYNTTKLLNIFQSFAYYVVIVNIFHGNMFAITIIILPQRLLETLTAVVER